MGGLTDIITEFLLATIGEDERITISRNNLAEHFSCAPSQINYVLSTRFSTDNGYIVESKRGGGGYITLIRLSSDRHEYLKEIADEVTTMPLSESRMTAILSKMCRDGYITEREGRLISAACSDKSFLTKTGEARDRERGIVFKNVLMQLLKEE